ncbi:hypothetical protein CCYS_10010 [Corynebacterium cystitidis DSM 20524]|uniref:Uncharacterized protein n=1 Tax=Corynebacterium cystitidis DSM 20524 TaxID=1121357 RepID=A0A1H9VML3_9CORY|nr:hypothetical protein CCYS_10010 [Corynebacterium cystitidis DSM 20524]SES22567.1 hypothetical protein SAMN05661109_02287 [Corynebacterium cystitidis DSM 20524]SNV69151.1 Uncharacterised protein [Corynebacterium cystitidis]
MIFNYVTEGRSDSGVAKGCSNIVGTISVTTINKRGVANLDQKISGYHSAAQQYTDVGWLILRDSDNQCPVTLRERFDPPSNGSANFIFRVVHSMTEGWLLSDAQSCADYFRIPKDRIPKQPEKIPHPKGLLLELCRKHSPKDIRDDMVTDDHRMGPLFADRLIEFAEQSWNIKTAASVSPSLNRAVQRLREI